MRFPPPFGKKNPKKSEFFLLRKFWIRRDPPPPFGQCPKKTSFLRLIAPLIGKMPYKELPWCLRRRLEECLKSFEGVRGLANWRPRWLLNLKGSFFDDTLVNRSATSLFEHPVYVTPKMDLKSERSETSDDTLPRRLVGHRAWCSLMLHLGEGKTSLMKEF